MARKSTAMLAFVLLIFLTAGSLLASGLILKKPIRNPDRIPTVVSSEKALKSSNHLMMSPGTVLDSTYYDWQRNGGLDDHLEMYDDGTNVLINGCMMVAYLEDTSDRAMEYYYWNGSSWMGHGQVVFPARSGFGSMSQFSDGRAAICAHTDLDGGGLRAYAAYDAFPGIYAFSYQGTSTTAALIWPRISVNSDGSISMTGVDQGNYNVSVVTGTEAGGFGEWDQNFRDIEPNWMDGDMEWPTIHSGTNGKVGVVIPDFAGAVRLFESTDNGGSWTSTTIAPADTAGAPTGLDSTAARLGWINSDIFYIGDEPHVAWTAGQVASLGGGSYGLFDFKATIYHWSPSTGIDEVVVASTQSADSTRSDYVPTPFNHMSVDWPQMGLATDGQTIVLVFTAFNPDDIDNTALPPAGYVDIWATWSTDNGNTWETPVNVTNPDGTNLGWDDRYPSIARTNMDNAADPGKDAYIIYTSDDLAGTFVQGTEAATNMDYVMFTGIDLGLGGIGDKGGSEVGLPKSFALSQNYPNPFNPSTTVDYQVAERSHVSLKVYDVRGRLVRTLVNGVKDAGNYSIQWDGTDTSGQQISSGIYLYTLETDNFRSTKKMVVLK